jgi:hypothetical protein
VANIAVNGGSSDSAEGSTAEHPLTVLSDNPWWHGSFDWNAGESASGACPPWFNNGVWDGIDPATLTLWHAPPQRDKTRAWSAPLLPGYYDHALSPEFAECSQTPESWPRAYFSTRAFNIWQGATFQVSPSVPGTGGITPSVFVKLSREILVVPVVVIHWDDENLLADVGTLFDFLPSNEYPPDIAPPLRPPSRPYPSPRDIDQPPDEIFKQCGIQFQIVRALHLGPPQGTDVLKCSTNSINCPGSDPSEQCACNTDEKMPDYVHNDELSARLRTALGAEFEGIFGPGGLNPILVQFGTPECVRLGLGPNLGACHYAGKAEISFSILGDVHVQGVVQINNTERAMPITAHELGHVLMPRLPGDGHSANPEDLMHASSGGSLISPGQCDMATETALGMAARYFDYQRRRGLTDPFSLVPDRSTRFPAARAPGAVSGEIPLVCCELADGQKIQTLAGLCFLRGGNRVSNCNVCCNASDDNFELVASCDPGDVVSFGQCSMTCCELGDREEQIPFGRCERVGEPCISVCCEIDGSARPLNRGECARQGGDEVSLTRCNEEPG